MPSVRCQKGIALGETTGVDSHYNCDISEAPPHPTIRCTTVSWHSRRQGQDCCHSRMALCGVVQRRYEKVRGKTSLRATFLYTSWIRGHYIRDQLLNTSQFNNTTTALSTVAKSELNTKQRMIRNAMNFSRRTSVRDLDPGRKALLPIEYLHQKALQVLSAVNIACEQKQHRVEEWSSIGFIKKSRKVIVWVWNLAWFDPARQKLQA